MIKEQCLASEIQELESEFWNHSMVGADVVGYTARFHELSRVVAHLVTPEPKHIEGYMFRLAPQIRSMVTAARPATIRDAIDLAFGLTKDAIRVGTLSLKGTAAKGSGSKVVEEKTVEGSGKKGKVLW